MEQVNGRGVQEGAFGVQHRSEKKQNSERNTTTNGAWETNCGRRPYRRHRSHWPTVISTVSGRIYFQAFWLSLLQFSSPLRPHPHPHRVPVAVTQKPNNSSTSTGFFYRVFIHPVSARLIFLLKVKPQ